MRNGNRAGGFTLMELLIVIAIIAVLLGFIFPVFQGVQDRARKVQAKNDLTQIVTAVNAFYTEYGRYPIDSTITTDAAATFGAGSTSSKVVFDELRAKTATLNTRQVVFISPPEDSAPSPKGKIGSDGQFRDPWASAYAFRMDADYDNQVANPYGTNGAGADPVRQGIIAWSFGKDTQLGNQGDSKYTGSDDVISWQ